MQCSFQQLELSDLDLFRVETSASTVQSTRSQGRQSPAGLEANQESAYPVPDNFSEKLDDCTAQGFRVIGLAYRSMQKEDLPKSFDTNREVVERDLTFLGLLIFENRLKQETSSVLQELSEANIRTVMVTGIFFS
ncbi:unnamed protein product, partial [Ranitomeya imitator]